MSLEAGRWGVVELGHLGGYVPGGDPDTYYPALWDWAIQEFNVETVLDVGCGDGGEKTAFTYFSDKLGWENVLGIDGVPQPVRNIVAHDFTTGPFHTVGSFNLCWCSEFVEHVLPQYIPNFTQAFKLCRWVMLTHALPGQAGYHHVNCQVDYYWIGAMEIAGFRYDAARTLHSRSLVGSYYAESGLIFENLDG